MPGVWFEQVHAHDRAVLESGLAIQHVDLPSHATTYQLGCLQDHVVHLTKTYDFLLDYRKIP